jgi:hypothetical protein
MSVWSSLVGQDHVVATLTQAVREPRAMTHAWLFTGPPGPDGPWPHGRSPPPSSARRGPVAAPARAAA